MGCDEFVKAVDLIGQLVLKLQPRQVEELVGDVALHHIHKVLELMPADRPTSHQLSSSL